MNIKSTLVATSVAFSSFVAVTAADAAVVYKTDTSSLDLGGRIQANFNSVEASSTHDKAALESKARLRTNGQAQIYDGIKAIGFAEWEVAAQSSQDGLRLMTGVNFASVRIIQVSIMLLTVPTYSPIMVHAVIPTGNSEAVRKVRFFIS